MVGVVQEALVRAAQAARAVIPVLHLDRLLVTVHRLWRLRLADLLVREVRLAVVAVMVVRMGRE